VCVCDKNFAYKDVWANLIVATRKVVKVVEVTRSW